MSNVILYGEGDQTMVFVPSILVQTASYIIEDTTQSVGNADRLIASGTATLDALSTTVSAESGAGTASPARIFVASTANVTGTHRYVISHVDDGQQEKFTAEGIFSGGTAYIETSSPLSRTYPTGSLVRGIRLTATFPAAEANDLTRLQLNEPYRIKWSYNIGGQRVVDQELVQFKRASGLDVQCDAVLKLIQENFTEYTTKFSENFSLATRIRNAKDEVEQKLLGKGIQPDTIMFGAQGKWLVYYWTLWSLAMATLGPANVDATFKDDTMSQFQEIFVNVTSARSGAETAQVDKVSDTTVTGQAMRYKSRFKKW